MGNYSFKSVGFLAGESQKSREVVAKSITPIGIRTPLRLGNPDEGFLGLNYKFEDEFADNLKNLILTNWGERVGLYDFGANLRPICTELISTEDFDTEAINRIRTAVQKWMPQISLEDFSSESDYKENKNTAIRKITVSYTIPAINSNKRAIQVVLYVI